MGALRSSLAKVCGWPQGLALWCCVAHRAAPSAVGIPLLPWLSRCGRHPWRHRLSVNLHININPTAEAVPASRRLTASPRPHPNPAVLAVLAVLAARGSQAPCSLPCSPSPPRAAPRRGPPVEHLRLRASPARTRQTLRRPTGKLRNGSRRDKGERQNG